MSEDSLSPSRKSLLVADLDGDGDADLAIANNGSEDVTVLLRK